jgi:hypothetical protein
MGNFPRSNDVRRSAANSQAGLLQRRLSEYDRSAAS